MAKEFRPFSMMTSALLFYKLSFTTGLFANVMGKRHAVLQVTLKKKNDPVSPESENLLIVSSVRLYGG